MPNRRLWLWAGASALILAGAASIGRSGAREDEPWDADHRFLRIGEYYLNSQRIDYVVNVNDGVMVVFGSDTGNRLKLTGSDADAMRDFLRVKSVGLRPSAATEAKKEVQQGLANPSQSQFGNEGFRNYQKRPSERKELNSND
jgi:hypothetical protein